MDPWKDFNSILFGNIVSSLRPVQILGQTKFFFKISQLKSSVKNLSQAKFQNVLKSS